MRVLAIGALRSITGRDAPPPLDGRAEARDCRGEFAAGGIADHAGSQGTALEAAGYSIRGGNNCCAARSARLADILKPRFVRVDGLWRGTHTRSVYRTHNALIVANRRELDGQIEIALSEWCGRCALMHMVVNEDALRRVLAALVQQ